MASLCGNYGLPEGGCSAHTLERCTLVEKHHSTDTGLLGIQQPSDKAVNMSTGGGHNCHRSWLIESWINGYREWIGVSRKLL